MFSAAPFNPLITPRPLLGQTRRTKLESERPKNSKNTHSSNGGSRNANGLGIASPIWKNPFQRLYSLLIHHLKCRGPLRAGAEETISLLCFGCRTYRGLRFESCWVANGQY